MNLYDYRILTSFLESFEAMIKYFSDAKDGRFKEIKAQAIVYIENVIKQEDERLKLYQDKEFHKKLLSFYNAVLDLLK